MPRTQIIRHYSLIGGPGLEEDPPNTYTIAIQRQEKGRGSNFMHNQISVGDRLVVGAPVNSFALDRQADQVLLLAAGIGITPIVSMVKSLMRRKKQFSLIYCGRSKAHMAYADELQTLCAERLHLHTSQTQGRLRLSSLLSQQAPNTQVYVCGPTSLIQEANQSAAVLKGPKARLHQETFVSSTQKGDTPFEVRLQRSQIQLKVGANESLLEALCSLPTPVYWSCRRGECGLCASKVISFDGQLIHRDRYLSDEEKEEGKSICLCVSRLQGQQLILDL